MNNSVYHFLLIVGLAMVALVACERKSMPIGGIDESTSVAEGATRAQLSTMPGPVHLVGLSGLEKTGEIDAEALFDTNCSACHQVSGLGVPAVFPPLDGSGYVVSDNTDRLAAIMIYGLQGEIEVKGTKYNSVMAGLGATMSDKELAAVASYIRRAWSNKADPVAEEVFTKIREKWGQRAMFNITELGVESGA